MTRFARTRRLLHWIAERLKDVFYDTDNEHLDGPRLLAYGAVADLMYAAHRNMLLGKEIDLGPGGLGGGLAAVLTAGAGFLLAKAYAKKKNRESAAIAQNVAVAAKNNEPVTPVEAVKP